MSARKAKLADCSGCYNDVYNHGCGGAKECFMLKSAVMEKVRVVSVDMPPPYKHLPLVSKPSCWRQQRYVTVKPDALTSDGYWKR